MIQTEVESCASCGETVRLTDTFAAEEEGREVEVVVTRCPGCGETSEEPEPVTDVAEPVQQELRIA